MFTRPLSAVTQPSRSYICYRCLIRGHRRRSQWVSLRRFHYGIGVSIQQHVHLSSPELVDQPQDLPLNHEGQLPPKPDEAEPPHVPSTRITSGDADLEDYSRKQDGRTNPAQTRRGGPQTTKLSSWADLSMEDARSANLFLLDEQKYTVRRNFAAAIAATYGASFHNILSSMQHVSWAELRSLFLSTQDSINQRGVKSPIFSPRTNVPQSRATLEALGINMAIVKKTLEDWEDPGEMAAVITGKFALSHDSAQALGLPILSQLVRPKLLTSSDGMDLFGYEVVVTGSAGLEGTAQAFLRQLRKLPPQDRTIQCPKVWVASPSETSSATTSELGTCEGDSSLSKKDILPTDAPSRLSNGLGSPVQTPATQSFLRNPDVLRGSTEQLEKQMQKRGGGHGETSSRILQSPEASGEKSEEKAEGETEVSDSHHLTKSLLGPSQLVNASSQQSVPTSSVADLLDAFRTRRNHWGQLKVDHEVPTPSESLPSGTSTSSSANANKLLARLVDLSNFSKQSVNPDAEIPSSSTKFPSLSAQQLNPGVTADEGTSVTKRSKPEVAADEGTSVTKRSNPEVTADEGTSVKERGLLKPRGIGATKASDPIENLSADSLTLESLGTSPRGIPNLAHDLQRVLFNPGVYQLQDPRTKVYNFSPYLQNIIPVSEFNFKALKDYIVSSKDETLRSMAVEHGARYYGSSSSMTSVLAQFHLILSQWRPVQANILSRSFGDTSRTFSKFIKAPTAVFAKYKDGTYAIDADKEFETTNVLMEVGKSLEKFLTLSPKQFERYRRDNEIGISEEERQEPEAFHYMKMDDFLMRSQLDAKDSRLPGTGIFDLKTRAVVAVRMNTREYDEGAGYQINHRFGNWQSYEREYFDMIRSAMLKYSLQVRMGRMDGIFVAYHNVERIFGFQYISLPEMDLAMHGQKDAALGDQEFKFSLKLWNEVLDRATEKFPEQSLRMHFETREGVVPFMYIFVEPVSNEEMEDIQTKNNQEIEAYKRELLKLAEMGETSASSPQEIPDSSTDAVEHGSTNETGPNGQTPMHKPLLAYALVVRNLVNGEVVERPEDLREDDQWTIEYTMSVLKDSHARHLYDACRLRRRKILDEGPPEDNAWTTNSYMQNLWNLSQEGRAQLKRELENEQNGETKLLYPQNQDFEGQDGPRS